MAAGGGVGKGETKPGRGVSGADVTHRHHCSGEEGRNAAQEGHPKATVQDSLVQNPSAHGRGRARPKARSPSSSPATSVPPPRCFPPGRVQQKVRRLRLRACMRVGVLVEQSWLQRGFCWVFMFIPRPVSSVSVFPGAGGEKNEIIRGSSHL